MMRKLSQRGDTIVEVLLAITITSAVIAGAYVATNRALKAAQAARERSEAIKIAETQIERLKYLSLDPDIHVTDPACPAATIWVDIDFDDDVDPGECLPRPNIFQTTPFCIPWTFTTPAYIDTDPSPDGINADSSPLGCKFDSNVREPLIRITYDPATEIHEIHVIWLNATGVESSEFEGTDEIKMYYRVYE